MEGGRVAWIFFLQINFSGVSAKNSSILIFSFHVVTFKWLLSDKWGGFKKKTIVMGEMMYEIVANVYFLRISLFVRFLHFLVIIRLSHPVKSLLNSLIIDYLLWKFIHENRFKLQSNWWCEWYVRILRNLIIEYLENFNLKKLPRIKLAKLCPISTEKSFEIRVKCWLNRLINDYITHSINKEILR